MPNQLMFKPMLITDLFLPHKGKRLIAAHRRPGRTPFVGGSELNNSITDFAELEPLFPGGWLTLVYNGSVGQTRFQPAPFFASDDVIALEPRTTNATLSSLLVCAAIIQRECVSKYSYGTKLNLKRLRRQTIMVPVTLDEDGNEAPDWSGMDRLGKELIAQVIDRARHSLSIIPQPPHPPTKLIFAPMLLTDVFESIRASAAWYDKSKLSWNGNPSYPFISRTRTNNGVDILCPRQAKDPEQGNAITLGLDTQSIAYQPAAFYTGQNIQVLRHHRLNEDNGLVLVTLMQSQLGKFSWGSTGATLGRLRKTRIMVPIERVPDHHAQETMVDWQGMELYGEFLRTEVAKRAQLALDALQSTASAPIQSSSVRRH